MPVDIPANLDQAAIVGTLGALGLTVPANLAAAVVLGASLDVASTHFPNDDVDAALFAANVSDDECLRFKTAMFRNDMLAGYTPPFA